MFLVVNIFTSKLISNINSRYICTRVYISFSLIQLNIINALPISGFTRRWVFLICFLLYVCKKSLINIKLFSTKHYSEVINKFLVKFWPINMCLLYGLSHFLPNVHYSIQMSRNRPIWPIVIYDKCNTYRCSR